MGTKTLAELQEPGNEVWRELEARLSDAAVTTSVLPLQAAPGAALQSLQISTGSTLGAVVNNCGGIIIDSGWIRLRGGGHEHVPAVADDPPGVLLIGHDIVGGRFALNSGSLGGAPGEVNYWSPDSLKWEAVGLGYTDFVNAFLGEAVRDFYSNLRWDGWQAESEALGLQEGIALYPPPFSEEGQDVNSVHRGVVPLNELHEVFATFAEQLNG